MLSERELGAEESGVKRRSFLVLALLAPIAAAASPAKDLQREDVVINARERMQCRREALEGAAARVRARREARQKEKGGRVERPPRIVPQRPKPRQTSESQWRATPWGDGSSIARGRA